MHKILNAFLLTISISAFAQESTAPKIHGADIYGAKPNRPSIENSCYRCKTNRIQCLGLPQGLTLEVHWNYFRNFTGKEQVHYSVNCEK